MTDLLDKLEEAREKATQGEWENGRVIDGRCSHILIDEHRKCITEFHEDDRGVVNVDYIALSHNSQPTLIAELRDLRKSIEHMGGMAGNPDAKAGCRNICKKAQQALARSNERMGVDSE